MGQDARDITLAVPSPTRAAESRQEWTWVAVLVLTTLALRLVFLAGPLGSDDTRYMDAAWKLAHGQPPGVLDHAYVRAAFIIWLAAWTRCGAGGTALLASQVFVSVALVLALYWLGRWLTADWRAALLGAMCWAFFPIELTYAGAVVPDQLGVLLALLAGGMALRTLRAPAGKGRLHLVAAGVLGGIAMSVKEPYALLPVIVGLWALWEIRPLRAALGRVVAIAAVALGTFALEYPFFRLWTGDWLYRHKALHIVYGPGGAITEEAHASLGTLIYYPSKVLLNPAVSGLFGWFLLIAALGAMRRVREFKFIALWSICFFAFLQFGSTTLSRYQPLPMQPRYVQPMIILLFIPLGRWLADLAGSAPFGRVGTALLLAGVSVQGVQVSEARSAQRLYYATFPRAVLRTLALEGAGGFGRVAIPEAVSNRLPPDLRERTDAWPKLDLRTGVTPGELEQLRREHAALLIPIDMAQLPTSTGDYRTLTTWLDQRARCVPVEDGQSFLNRFFLVSGIGVLRRRAARVAIACLYLFTD